MSIMRGKGAQPTAEITLANAILDVLDQPSLLIRDTGVILAANHRWRTIFSQEHDSPTLPTVSEWLSGIEGGDRLLHALESMQSVDEPFELHIANVPQLAEARYAARLTRLAAQDRDLEEAIILLAEIDDHSTEDEVDQIMIDQINYLLVRQTLIEERERRRLGREVHDHVTQLLVGIRRQLADVRDNKEPLHPAETIADVDRVIRVLQELTSSFSPPCSRTSGCSRRCTGWRNTSNRALGSRSDAKTTVSSRGFLLKYAPSCSAHCANSQTTRSSTPRTPRSRFHQA